MRAALILAGGGAGGWAAATSRCSMSAARPSWSTSSPRSTPVHVAISANGDPARFAAFALPVLADGEFAGEGPLAGLLAGLDWAAALGADGC